MKEDFRKACFFRCALLFSFSRLQCRIYVMSKKSKKLEPGMVKYIMSRKHEDWCRERWKTAHLT